MDLSGERGDVYKDQAELAEHGLPTGFQVFRSASIRACGFAMAVFLHPGVDHARSPHWTVVTLPYETALQTPSTAAALELLRKLSGTAPVILLNSPARGVGPFVSCGRFRMHGYALESGAPASNLRLLFTDLDHQEVDCSSAIPGLREGSMGDLLDSSRPGELGQPKKARRVSPVRVDPPAAQKRSRVIVTVKPPRKAGADHAQSVATDRYAVDTPSSTAQGRAQPQALDPPQCEAPPQAAASSQCEAPPQAAASSQAAVPPQAAASSQALPPPSAFDAYQEALLAVLIRQNQDPRCAARAILDMFDLTLKGSG